MSRRSSAQTKISKLERVFLLVFNALARLFGVLALLAGIVSLLSAALFSDHRLLYAITGIFACATGIAFLMARCVGPEELDRFRP
jgi:hypothetical protein